jgi:hypothetical protein
MMQQRKTIFALAGRKKLSQMEEIQDKKGYRTWKVMHM